MNRALTILVFGVMIFGGWALLKAKLFMPAVRKQPVAAPVAPSQKILWSADGSEIQASGDDPRAVFSAGLSHYLSAQVANASIIPPAPIDPMVVSLSEEKAHLSALVRGIRYDGLLRWTDDGWELIQISQISQR